VPHFPQKIFIQEDVINFSIRFEEKGPGATTPAAAIYLAFSRQFTDGAGLTLL